MSPPRTGRLAKVLLPLIILALAAAAFAYMRATKPQIAGRPLEEKAWPVEVAAVHYGDVRPRIVEEGVIVAGREAELRPLVAGRIVEVAPEFTDGGVVEAGQTLVGIDPFAYEEAVAERRAELAEAEARVAELEAELRAEREQLRRDEEQLQLAREDLARSEQLRRAGTVSQRALDQARIVASEREQRVLTRRQSIGRNAARLEQARAQVLKARSTLDRAERSLADTVLTAPFAGTVAETAAAVGKMVGVSDRLGRLVELQSLEARFHLPDAVYARLLDAGPLEALPVRVIWQVGGRSLTWEATLARRAAEIEPTSGGVELYARLTGLAPDTPLRPGAFVTVEIADRLRQGVARVPARALHDGGTVYVVGAEDRLAAREVEPVAREGDDVLLRGGVAEGERVVLTRFPEIAPGLKVSVP